MTDTHLLSADRHTLASQPDARPVLARQAELLLLLAAATVLVRWAFALFTGATFEDAYISLRYAENLAAGRGLVYNPGERVFGATTPLYLLFLSGLVKAGLPALSVAKVLAAAADGLTFWLWGRELLRRTGSLPALLFFWLLFGLGAPMVQVSVSGMETSLALLLVTLALTWDLADRPLLSGGALGVLCLVRPEGALVAVVILGLRAVRTRRLPWAPALLIGLIVLPWVVAATLYYGSPVPHSIPAKAAAYNAHRPGVFPNFADTLAYFAPIRGPWGRLLISLAVLPCLLAGLREAYRAAWLRPLAALFLVWWAYLVVPKTLLFTWYLPPLLLPAYALAAFGLAGLVRDGWAAIGLERVPRLLEARALAIKEWLEVPARPVLALALLGVAGWLSLIGPGARRIQVGERSVRREIGLWLRANTPENARVALEPIGYIGYFSGRRILDEVGLVSPEMVPLNRRGAGWFARMLREMQPEFVVERPHYLLRNETLNSEVPMFRTDADRAEFLRDYEAVALFSSGDVPQRLQKDYRFAIYRRRDPARRAEWARRWERLTPEERGDLACRALTGPVDLLPRTALDPPRDPRRPESLRKRVQ